MRKFEISDEFTTSDIGLELRGDSLAELFQAGAEGMFEIILGHRETGAVSLHRRVDLRAGSSEQLLVDWLSELLYAFDAEGIIPGEYRLTITEDQNGAALKSEMGCFRFDPETYNAEHEVKAVTYYKLNINKDGDLYRCHLVFDL